MKSSKHAANVSWFRVSFFVCLLVPLLSVVGFGEESTKRILILFWYNKDYPWNVKFDQRFQEVLHSNGPFRVEYYTEYLETNRFPGDFQTTLLRDYLRQKYADSQIDVVVANSDTSLDFLLKSHSDLFPRSPIVFVATKHPTEEELQTPPGLTGIINISTHAKTLDLALKLHPDTEQVFVISGTLENDRRLESIARDDLRDYENKVRITYLTDLPPAELIAQTRRLPRHSIILYVWQQARDEQGKVLESVDVLTLIAKSAQVPIYGMALPYLGNGVIGGYINTAEAGAARVAEMALRVASGEPARNIPVESAPTSPMFDHHQLQHWNIDESSLPPGSTVMFKDIGLWYQYGRYIVLAVVLIVGQAILIAWLLAERRKRWRSEEARRHLVAIVESSKDAIIGTSLDMEILSWNPGAESLYGYTAAEVMGRHVSIIVPSDLKEEFDARLAQRNRGEDIKVFETVRVNKNGNRIDVSISVSTIKDARGRVIAYATIHRDVSERKRAEEEIVRREEELRESHTRIQKLASSLINLQDEERRRIAAELHDGLGQSLAIINNRALIGLRDTVDADRVTEQFEEISLAALSAIDEVREITHNLRPRELEKLGLVQAVKSMIAKVSNSSSIHLDSDLDQLDGLLSLEAETSIYRIVQEGLNNIVKHADATEARVSVKRHGSELVITVADNGKGISLTNGKTGNGRGFGLAGIAERARMLGGSCVVESTPGQGTVLTLSAKLSKVSNERQSNHSNS